jgi:hypothetical protein
MLLTATNPFQICFVAHPREGWSVSGRSEDNLAGSAAWLFARSNANEGPASMLSVVLGWAQRFSHGRAKFLPFGGSGHLPQQEVRHLVGPAGGDS